MAKKSSSCNEDFFYACMQPTSAVHVTYALQKPAMKNKLLALAASIAFVVSVHATIHMVHVKNYQFSPSNVTALVGDTIRWIWDQGFHTTTSTSVPSGADTWDAPMQSTNTQFDYKITAAGTYNYVCNFHPNMVAKIEASAALPLQLISFNVSNNSNSALLQWKTASEQNTSYFSVRRSYDRNNFTEIARINAAGTSLKELAYSFTDKQPSTHYKYVYYMLVITDVDGKQQLSNIEMFKNNAAKPTLITQLNPNPIKRPGHLMLQFNADKNGSMQVQVYNTSGALVMQTQMAATEGLNNGHLHLGDLANGVYTIVFSLDNIRETKRVVLQ